MLTLLSSSDLSTGSPWLRITNLDPQFYSLEPLTRIRYIYYVSLINHKIAKHIVNSHSYKAYSYDRLTVLTSQDTLTFELVGSESAMQVFYINPTTGLVSLKKSLAETVDETFTVSFLLQIFETLFSNKMLPLSL